MEKAGIKSALKAEGLRGRRTDRRMEGPTDGHDLPCRCAVEREKEKENKTDRHKSRALTLAYYDTGLL